MGSASVLPHITSRGRSRNIKRGGGAIFFKKEGGGGSTKTLEKNSPKGAACSSPP